MNESMQLLKQSGIVEEIHAMGKDALRDALIKQSAQVVDLIVELENVKAENEQLKAKKKRATKKKAADE